MSKVGKNIKKIRGRTQMTQDELAEKLFVTRQTISNWETGRSNPDIDMILKLAEALDTTANMLIYGEDRTGEPFGAYVYSKRKVLIIDALVILAGAVIAYSYSWVLAYEASYYTMNVRPLFIGGFFPAYWIFLGWNIMQTLGMTGAARPLTFKYKKVVRRMILILLILYGIIILPMMIESIFATIQFWQLDRSSGSWSWSGPEYFLHEYMEMFIGATWKFWLFIWDRHFLFLIPGILLWLMRPSEKPVCTK